jgi:hypothetical protein
MPCPPELEPLLGHVADVVVAARAGVSKQAVAKWRRSRGLAAFGGVPKVAARAPVDRAHPTMPDPTTTDRLAYLEDTLRCVWAAIENGSDQKATASLHNVALKVRAELDELRKAESIKKAKAPGTLAEQVEAIKRDCEQLPDQLLEAVVEVYCARYRLDWPRMLSAVGARSRSHEKPLEFK